MIYDDKKFIGRVIRQARKRAGLSQAELAEMVNMTDKNLCNIENGKQFPQLNNFFRILEILKLTTDDFQVNCPTPTNNPIKNEVLKIVLASSDKEMEGFLNIIHTIKTL